MDPFMRLAVLLLLSGILILAVRTNESGEINSLFSLLHR